MRNTASLQYHFIVEETGKSFAWRLSNTMETSFCIEALEEALARYGRATS